MTPVLHQPRHTPGEAAGVQSAAAWAAWLHPRPGDPAWRPRVAGSLPACPRAGGVRVKVRLRASLPGRPASGRVSPAPRRRVWGSSAVCGGPGARGLGPPGPLPTGPPQRRCGPVECRRSRL